MTTEAENLKTHIERVLHSGLWYYEGTPEQHCELVSWIGEEVVMRPIDGSPNFTCNGSFAWPVKP
jgi:hypothetical protein